MFSKRAAESLLKDILASKLLREVGCDHPDLEKIEAMLEAGE